MRRIIIILILFFTINSNAQIITTVAGIDTAGFSGDNGHATDAKLNYPLGVTVDVSGNIYISDEMNNRIRKVDTNGIITTFAGTGVFGYNGDNKMSTNAEITDGCYLFMRNDGNLYLADELNGRIRKINIRDTITTIAGSAIIGCIGDNGFATLAQLGNPAGITIDGMGNIYYADDGCSRVRKIDTAGIITNFAGSDSIGFAGNGGPADSAALFNPVDVAIDSKGNVYISDLINNMIRKVDIHKIITTFAGTGAFGYTGDGGPATAATFNYPEGLAVDGAGNVFFADQGNNVIRKIDTLGIITTVVGDGYGAGLTDSLSGLHIGGFSGDGGPATAAELYLPAGIAFDVWGNLYIADWYNQRIRKVTNVGVPLKQSEVRGAESWSIVSVYPNPANTLINFQFSTPIDATIKITNIEGQVLQTVPVSNATMASINIAGYAPGMYLYQVVTKAETQVGKVVKE